MDRSLTRSFTAALVAGLCLIVQSSLAGECANQVVSFNAGSGAGFGAANFPANVLGVPHGNANPNTPTFDEVHLLSLGDGGEIVLRISGHAIVNGPGPDFTVFENALIPIGQPTQVFADTAVVSVSDDGTSWTTFPFNYVPPAEGGTLLDRASYIGFAGVNPVYSSPANGISPYDPAVSGGDSFDLADIGLQRIQFVKIRDTGTTGPTQTMDGDGEIVTDSGALMNYGGSMGFDLDALAGINVVPVNTAVRNEFWLYE